MIPCIQTVSKHTINGLFSIEIYGIGIISKIVAETILLSIYIGMYVPVNSWIVTLETLNI